MNDIKDTFIAAGLVSGSSASPTTIHLTHRFQACKQRWRRVVIEWIVAPAGLLIVLLLIFAIRECTYRAGVALPAAVLLLIIVFLVLIILDRLLPKRRMEQVIHNITIPVSLPIDYLKPNTDDCISSVSLSVISTCSSHHLSLSYPFRKNLPQPKMRVV